jgi:proteasome lid subunit RPN8/RPN11
MASLSFLTDQNILDALLQAWQDSHPGISGGHEEGGFVLRDEDGRLNVRRWQQGEQDKVILPSYKDCRFDEQDIVATFHTHPNTGSDYLQEPSETDKRAVRDDPNLKATYYAGELVISQEKIYLIEPYGQVSEVGNTREILVMD